MFDASNRPLFTDRFRLLQLSTNVIQPQSQVLEFDRLQQDLKVAAKQQK